MEIVIAVIASLIAGAYAGYKYGAKAVADFQSAEAKAEAAKKAL